MVCYCRNSHATAAVTNFVIEEFTQVPLQGEEVHDYCSRHKTLVKHTGDVTADLLGIRFRLGNERLPTADMVSLALQPREET